MEDSWFSPVQTYEQVEGGPGPDVFPDPFGGIPVEGGLAPLGPFQYERGSMGVNFTRSNGNIWFMQAERPMKVTGPSVLYVEVHTTGVKCRALGHDNEKACWSMRSTTLWNSGTALTPRVLIFPLGSSNMYWTN